MRTLTGFACVLFLLPAMQQGKLSKIEPATFPRVPQLFQISKHLPALTATWTGATSSDWNTATNWDVGSVPIISTTVIIPAAVLNSPSVSSADAAAASVNINSGASLSMSGAFNLTLSTGAVFTNDGTFNSGSGSGAVIFSGTGTINGSSSISFNNVIINGNLAVSTAPTINGNFLINGGTVSAAPVYGSSSTLAYNTSAATYNVGQEWNKSSTTGAAGSGNPQNVTIQNVNVVTMPNGDRRVPGNLIISAGGLTLSNNTNKDLYIGGNWTNNGGFTHNNRKVTFNGISGIQSISGTGNNTFYDLTLNNSGATTNFGSGTITIDSVFRVTSGTMDGNTSTVIFKGNPGLIAGGGTKRFYNLHIDAGANVSDLVATAGDIHVANSYTNNGIFTQDSSHTTFFDKSNSTETLSGTGTTTFGSLTVGGPGFSFPTTLNAGSHSFTVCGRTFKFNSSNSSFDGNSATVTFALTAAGVCTIKNSGSASNTAASFYNVVISSGAALTGVDFGNGISTIDNYLTINTQGYVTNNAPKYASTSTLVYNSTSGSYAVGSEWTGNATTAGTGIPQNVTIQNTSSVNMPNSDRGMAGNLNISSGTLTLNSALGNLYIAGDWNKASGTSFVSNGHTVIFNGSNTQTIGGTGATTFDNLINSNTSADIILDRDIVINDIFNANNNSNLSIGDNAITLDGTVTGTGTLSGASLSDLIINGTGSPLGTLFFKTGKQLLNSLTLNRTGITNNFALALGTDLTVNNLNLAAGVLATGSHLLTWNNTGNLTAPNIPWSANNTNYSDSYIATCNSDGTALTLTNPFTGDAGFKILQVGSMTDSSYFPVGADFKGANRAMIKMNGSAASDLTIVVGKGDIGSTPHARVNRIWYINANNTTGTLSSSVRLFFTKRNWTSWPSEDETEVGYDFARNYLVQKDYSGAGYFINLAASTDIKNFSVGYLYDTEIFGQYNLNVSAGYDGSKNGITQFNKFSVVNGSDLVLALFIGSVVAKQEGNDIKVLWEIANETNTHHYEIERASDAIHFVSIGSVQPGNNGLDIEYVFTDKQPLNGNNYYRIARIDESETVSYSSTAMVNFREGRARLFIYPNPTKHVLNLQLLYFSIGDYSLQMFDCAGRIVLSTRIENAQSSTTHSMILPNSLGAGIYRIVLRSNEGIAASEWVVVEN